MMLAYGPNRRAACTRQSSPNLMLAIVAAHVAAIAALMSAKMDLPSRFLPQATKIFFVPEPIAPPPDPADTPPRPATDPRPFVAQDPVIPSLDAPNIADDPIPLPIDPVIPTPGSDGTSKDPPSPIPATPAILLTGADELRPPYPASKLASGEEAVLKLRLTVASDGRVTAVESLGRADPTFLAAARRHLLTHWRYRPASRDGRDVMTQIVVTLRFELSA